MLIIDAHCDTITRMMEEHASLLSNRCHIDLHRLRKYPGYIQFLAAFIEPSYSKAFALKRVLQILDAFYTELEKNQSILSLCLNGGDIENALREGKTGAILSIEDGAALAGDLSVLRMLFKLGVRSICLTWNYRNEIADGVKESVTSGGLTLFGREVVKEMNRLGMLIDVSHLSEKGFWDVLNITASPVIASHSNARHICSHPRNLHDEQLLALKKNGGVVGINFYPPFLSDSGKAGICDIIKHIEHISAIAGIDHVGLGADFDGIEETPDDIMGVQDLYKVFDALAALNYPEACIRKLAGENFLRVIREVMLA